METQGGCLDPESHELLDMLNTTCSSLPLDSPRGVQSVGDDHLLLLNPGDVDPRSPSPLLPGSVSWSLTLSFFLSFQKRVLFLTNDYFFTDISGTPFR